MTTLSEEDSGSIITVLGFLLFYRSMSNIFTYLYDS